MIKVDKGNIEISGNLPLIMAELTTLVHVMHHDTFTRKLNMTPEESKELIMEAFQKGFLTEDEVKEDTKEHLLNLLDKIKELIVGKGDE